MAIILDTDYPNLQIILDWICKDNVVKESQSVICSLVSDSATPWTITCQAPLSMGFPKKEYWSGLPFPSSGDLPDPGIGPRSPGLQAVSLPAEPPDNHQDNVVVCETSLGLGNERIMNTMNLLFIF